jgi:hypothetical protein
MQRDGIVAIPPRSFPAFAGSKLNEQRGLFLVATSTNRLVTVAIRFFFDYDEPVIGNVFKDFFEFFCCHIF